ncbi:Uncharacterised protein [Mycobacterium tuberculosis]|nr:Uncharacterised protein [Mycobacterium tuberculosis]
MLRLIMLAVVSCPAISTPSASWVASRTLSSSAFIRSARSDTRSSDGLCILVRIRLAMYFASDAAPCAVSSSVALRAVPRCACSWKKSASS